jgi:hypothetical protein
VAEQRWATRRSRAERSAVTVPAGAALPERA